MSMKEERLPGKRGNNEQERGKAKQEKKKG
jgi:hypothetical protein